MNENLWEPVPGQNFEERKLTVCLTHERYYQVLLDEDPCVFEFDSEGSTARHWAEEFARQNSLDLVGPGVRFQPGLEVEMNPAEFTFTGLNFITYELSPPKAAIPLPNRCSNSHAPKIYYFDSNSFFVAEEGPVFQNDVLTHTFLKENPGYYQVFEETCEELPVKFSESGSEEDRAAESFALAANLLRVGPVIQYTGNTLEGAAESAAMHTFSSGMNYCQPAVITFNGLHPITKVYGTLHVSLPPLPSGGGPPALHYFLNNHTWAKGVPQEVRMGTLLTCLPTSGSYQVFTDKIKSEAKEAAFSFGEVYVFPNPVTEGYEPTLYVELPLADKIGVRVYDVSGGLVISLTDLGAPSSVQGRMAYRKSLGGGLKPGAYLGVVSAEKVGHNGIQKKFRFAILK